MVSSGLPGPGLLSSLQTILARGEVRSVVSILVELSEGILASAITMAEANGLCLDELFAELVAEAAEPEETESEED